MSVYERSEEIHQDPSIHLPAGYPGSDRWGQQSKQRRPNCPLPTHHLPVICGDKEVFGSLLPVGYGQNTSQRWCSRLLGEIQWQSGGGWRPWLPKLILLFKLNFSKPEFIFYC